ncbi:hypothetical protein [Plantactinospora soyae]|uniref:Uncharacterized protein n=1 Tax=Plantactinospora soyae TaxID=1544732 RepID=A0A927M791_9ACTN|nr:hypothetical protein [Plantactinospora soyae]MBE1489064.1 hypothetical protein [Plantactinospora soyae]
MPLPGTVLELAKEDWRYGGHTLFLLVEFVRLDLSVYYDNQWVWITGQQLARDGTPMGHLDALVRVSALPSADPAPGAPPAARADAGSLPTARPDAGSLPAGRPTPAPRQRVQNDGRQQHRRSDHEANRRVELPQEHAGGDRPEHQTAQ